MTKSTIDDPQAQKDIIEFIEARMPGSLCVVLLHDNALAQSMPITNMIPKHAVDITAKLLKHMLNDVPITRARHTVQ